jgi:hypothetical protein
VYTDDEIRKAILRKMLRQGFNGGKHTAIENLPKGLPDDKKTKKRAKKLIDNLVKEGYLVLKPTSYGMQTSLDPKMLPKVKAEIQEE